MALDGRVAIVTGGAKGIGYAIARRFLHDGARVVIADSDEKAGNVAAEELADLGDVVAVSCNVAERLHVHNLLAAAFDRFGDVDILVNNAGIVDKANFLELDEADFSRVLDVNLKGAFLCAQAVARHLVEKVKQGRPAGAVVNVSSVNAVLAVPDQVAYSISKGGLNQLTKVMALSLAPYGIRVNGIGPGSIMTDLLKGVVDDEVAMQRLMSRTPLGRIGEPREIAAIASFLASDEASYVTGQTVYADGGCLPLNDTLEPAADDDS
ncbi:SDR family oxidoreductase [Jiella sp. MQZ9-1]|uniref:SDR family oxidoreductase n=1 Tax=Jiella flava TaxID=2816857 RepID=A0A939JRT8_9HYPH|nr:SDR family oxidoreductase [Jiella flava]MBO0662253.1 SDR family oxidoreductase [Jiella flava]MCD2470916.1 SDR family oxidoreductase [Jiella flava]